MAQMLKQQFELTALKITVRPRGADISALFELEIHAGGKPAQLIERWFTAAELGLPRRVQPGWPPRSTLPDGFLAELAQALAQLHLPPDHPLWLHLVKPYGMLGMFAWEEQLVPALGRPVLRLPDFLERPRERRDMLEVALVCSEPVSEPSIHPMQLLPHICGAILSGTHRPQLRVHVFADQMLHAPLVQAFSAEPRVVVHDPESARRHGVLGRGSLAVESRDLRNPWLLWVRDATRGRSLDAVHFVCHGIVAGDRPGLSLAESPLSNRDREDARYVGVAELVAFLTQTGAWSAVFSDPPGNYSEAGLRLLADTLAQARPGPVVHHLLRPGLPSDMLAQLYGFLYAAESGPVPEQRGWFAYCQPALVDTQAPMAATAPRASVALDANAALLRPDEAAVAKPRRRLRSRVTAAGESGAEPGGPPAEPATVPGWVSASQRYVEQIAADLSRQPEPARSPAARGSEVERTLAALQAIVADMARKGGPRGTP